MSSIASAKVAAIVRAADTQERALAQTMLERSRKPEWTDAEFVARSEMIGVLFDGLVIRTVNNLDSLPRAASGAEVGKINPLS